MIKTIATDKKYIKKNKKNIYHFGKKKSTPANFSKMKLDSYIAYGVYSTFRTYFYVYFHFH